MSSTTRLSKSLPDPQEERCPACFQSSTPFCRGPEALDLWRCMSCGIVFLAQHQASHSEVEQLEREHFSDGFVGRQSVWQSIFDRHTNARTRRRILRYKQSGSLLGVGVGNGSFLRAFSDSGFDCTGVEPSPAIVDHVRKNHRLNVVTSYLEDYRPAGGMYFDIAVVNHVLEHMPEPRSALKHLRSLIADDGLVHIAVPNISAWESWLPGWTSYEPYHLFYYSARTLQRALKDAGFRIVQVETVEPFSGWFNAIVRTVMGRAYQMTRRRFEVANQAQRPSTKDSILVNGLNFGRILVGALIFPLRWFQAYLGSGEELIVLAIPNHASPSIGAHEPE